MKLVILDCDLKKIEILVKSYLFLFGLSVLKYVDIYDNTCIVPLSDIYSIEFIS